MGGDTPSEGGTFTFLYRTDRGVIDRRTWWRGTIPLVVTGVLALAGWLLVGRYTHDAIHQPPALAVLGYVYLLVFAFATLILFVCEYNLSAKRFAARGKPRALAAVLPLGVLLAATLAWYIPRSEGVLPGWSAWFGVAAVAAIVAWFVTELGLRDDPHSPQP